MKYHIVFSKTGIFNNDLFRGEFETIPGNGCKGTFSKNDYFDIIVPKRYKKVKYAIDTGLEQNSSLEEVFLDNETRSEHNTNSYKYFLEENDDLMEVLADRFRIFHCKYRDYLRCSGDSGIERIATLGVFGYLLYDHAAWEDYANARMNQYPITDPRMILEFERFDEERRFHSLMMIDDFEAFGQFCLEMDIAFTDEDMARLEVITVEY